MSDRHFISVVIPTFNRALQVQAALKSVLAQTYPEFEAIVVDDGSTDGTCEALQELISQHGDTGKPIRYFFQPNQGQSVARNKGIAEARGEWIAFLDSDDVWLPEKLDWQVRAIEQFGKRCCACITDARLTDNLGKDTTAFLVSGTRFDNTLGEYPGVPEILAKCRDPFWVSTLLASTDVVKHIGSFDADIGYAEDHDFLFRLSLATSFCYVNKPLALLNRSKSPQGSICRPWDNVDVRLRGSRSMFEKWLTLDPRLSQEVRKTLVQNLRHVHSAWANWYLEHQQYQEAREAVSKAMSYEFTSRLAVKWALTRFAPRFASRFSPRMKVQ